MSGSDTGRPVRPASRPLTALARHLRSRLFDLAILLLTLGHGIAILAWYGWRPTPRGARRLLTSWAIAFLWLARHILGIRYHVEGWDQRPVGPALFVANHQSMWETIAFWRLVPDIAVVTKRSLFRLPVFGWGMRHAPMIPVDRDRGGPGLRQLMAETRAAVAEGRSLLIFPEGTRVPVGDVRPFRRGVMGIYRACGVPIVPVVHNAGLVWATGLDAKRPGLVTVKLLAPIPAGLEPEVALAEAEAAIRREKDRLPGVAAAT
ncbi:MAG: lysophospholipid acyltransferase family protein [Pikeienuella sp.]